MTDPELKTVPVPATAEQIEAARNFNQGFHGQCDLWAGLYEAMVTAAPPSPPSPITDEASIAAARAEALAEAERIIRARLRQLNPASPASGHLVDVETAIRRALAASPPQPVAGDEGAPIEDGEADFWIVYFDDRDEPPAIFTGPTAEEMARKLFASKHQSGWNCHLLRRVASRNPILAAPPPPPADLKAFIRQYICDGDEAEIAEQVALVGPAIEAIRSAAHAAGKAEALKEVERLRAVLRKIDYGFGGTIKNSPETYKAMVDALSAPLPPREES